MRVEEQDRPGAPSTPPPPSPRFEGRHLRVEGASRVAEVLGRAEDEAGQDLLLLDALQPQFKVLSRTRVLRLHVVRKQAEHLHGVLPAGGERTMLGAPSPERTAGDREATYPVRHHHQLLRLADGARLELPQNHGAHVLQGSHAG